MKKNQHGFTLAELLVVIAIVGILAAISIPIFTAQMHKAKVAADWANLRAYYAEIQADYMSTQKKNPKVKIWGVDKEHDYNSVTFLDGHKAEMKAGTCAVSFDDKEGYQIVYDCKKGHPECSLGLGVKYPNP